MKFAILSAALVATASAGTLSLHLAKSAGDGQLLKRHARRDSSVTGVSLFDTGYSYYVDLAIGSPPQKVPVSIDTGSSDPWTNTKQSGVCDEIRDCFTPCQYFSQDAGNLGTRFLDNANSALIVDLNKSNTTRTLHVSGPQDDEELPFKVMYLHGASANGTYITETVSIGGFTLKNQTLGAANQSDFRSGILGLGYNIVQGEARRKDPLVNNTIIDGLVNQGAINRRIFSLSLGHTSSTNGSLVFGGVDTERYYDSLVGIPMVPSRGAPYVIEYAVKLEELEIKGVKDLSGSTEPVTVVLDNGAPQNVLPEKLVKPIQKTFEALSYTDDSGIESDGYVNCAMGRKLADARFGFKFTGKTIYISGAEAVRDIFSTGEQTFLKQKLGSKSEDWDGVCFLAFAVQPEGAPALVGDPLLRHAYAVYDMDNKVIALAQANIKSTKHNLVEIGKDDEIPDTKGEPSKLHSCSFYGID